MADRPRLNQLSPPLMHVFRDAHANRSAPALAPESDGAGVRARTRFPITERMLRGEVQRDLDALMNQVHLEATLSLEGFDHVRRSILNYGIPDLGARSLTDATIAELCREIAATLMVFEPRLSRQSIKVSRAAASETDVTTIRFFVQADLICDPQNLPVEFVADIDIQSGKFSVERA